jgi:N-hydroxyarylamine O-acetyltransferase
MPTSYPPVTSFVQPGATGTLASVATRHETGDVLRLDDELTRAYLDRIGVDAAPPSAETLADLVRAHVERVPYETVWIHAGQQRGIDQSESVRHVVEHRRGGYCYHLNGALAALLASLGYDVTLHVGGVHGPAVDAAGLGNHLVLLVHGVASDEHPDGTWYVDAGLGDALHEPVPLAPASIDQPPFTLALEPSPVDAADWHLRHDERGSFGGMLFGLSAVEMDVFRAHHERLSTSPESGFVRTMTAQRRDATGVDIVRARTLSRVDSTGTTSLVLERDEWFDALASVFGLDLPDVDTDGRVRLWRAVSEQHDRFVAAASDSPAGD